MERIKNIECLRFLFSLVIVLYHLRFGTISIFNDQVPLYANIVENTTYARLAVEFFFIVAGFFMFMLTDFTQRYVDFAKKKLIRFMPTILVLLLITFIFTLFTPLSFAKYDNFFVIFNIQSIGLTFRNNNMGTSWFVCSMFWAMSFYFYLRQCVNEKLFNLITACVIIFCYSFWIHSSGSWYENVAYVFNIGMMRAFAGIGLGYFLAMAYKAHIKAIKAIVLNVWQKLLVTGLELYLFGFLFYYLVFHKLNYNNKMILVLSFVCLFVLFIIKKGYFSRLLENNFSVFLGQFAFAIFLSHPLVQNLWKIFVCKQHPLWVIAHPYLNLILHLIVVILFGVGVFYFIEKPATKYFKNKGKSA